MLRSLPVRPSSPSSCSRSVRARFGELPASRAGSSTLSATDRLDTRLKNWKTIPIRFLRSTAQRASL